MPAKYPWLRIEPLRAGLDYYVTKTEGAAKATGEVVVFFDSDCRYESSCLRNLLALFSDPNVHVVSGETSVAPRGIYGMAMAVAFVFSVPGRKQKPFPGSIYIINNVGIRAETLRKHPLPLDLPLYRGNCVVHSLIMRRAGFTILRHPGAKSKHPPPEGVANYAWRFLFMGHDAVMTRQLMRKIEHEDPSSASPSPIRSKLGELFSCMSIVRERLIKWAQRAKKIVARQPLCLPILLASLPVIIVSAWLFLVGVIITWIKHDLLLTLYKSRA